MEGEEALFLVLHCYYVFQKYRWAKPGNLLLLMPGIIGQEITFTFSVFVLEVWP
jgi:hypothetical protein